MVSAINVVIAACVVAFAAWLSEKSPGIAGFIVALPLVTLLTLPMSQLQHGNTENTVLFARSIFVAIPVSLAFFIPFLISDRWGLTFWQAYGLGYLCLLAGFFLHRIVVGVLWPDAA